MVIGVGIFGYKLVAGVEENHGETFVFFEFVVSPSNVPKHPTLRSPRVSNFKEAHRIGTFAGEVCTHCNVHKNKRCPIPPISWGDFNNSPGWCWV